MLFISMFKTAPQQNTVSLQGLKMWDCYAPAPWVFCLLYLPFRSASGHLKMEKPVASHADLSITIEAEIRVKSSFLCVFCWLHVTGDVRVIPGKMRSDTKRVFENLALGREGNATFTPDTNKCRVFCLLQTFSRTFRSR